jgi:putative SOS response-associated peptidase YedK
MCGRYATTRTATDLSAIFDAIDATGADDPVAIDYNVAPTDPVPIVRMSSSYGDGDSVARVLSVARWGLVPPWATDRRGGARMINARAETVATTRAYAKPFATRRCLIPATGWYEFAAPAATAGAKVRKQPYFMTPLVDEPVVFAGLWSVWSDRSGEEKVITCSIVTTEALGPLAAVHDRMPLFLGRGRWESWLTATEELDGLLKPPTTDEIAQLEIRPVGQAVGNVRSDGPGLIIRTDGHADNPVDLTLF